MKRIISVLLCAALLLSALPLASAAKDTPARTDMQTELSGANGVGTLLAKTLEESGKTEENVNCLQDISVEGGEATVLLSTIVDAELIVAVYEEESDRLVTSGTASVHMLRTRSHGRSPRALSTAMAASLIRRATRPVRRSRRS